MKRCRLSSAYVKTSNIQTEYAGTNLASASVQQARGSGDKKNQHASLVTRTQAIGETWVANKKAGRRPDDPCYMRNHPVHKNEDCSVQKLNARTHWETLNARAAKAKFDKNGDKICEFLTNRSNQVSAWSCMQRVTHNVPSAIIQCHSCSPVGHWVQPSDDLYDRRNRHTHKKSRKSKKRRKHSRRSRYDSTSDSSSSSSSSSDFL